MEQCTRCILNATFPNIFFDEKGVCNYCNEWDKKWKNFDYALAENELKALFVTAASKKRQYDCLIPFSGGRDSSYVAYLCKKKYKLKPLLVTFNNLFMNEYAHRNIFKTVEKLGVDHIMLTYRPDQLKKYYRSMIKDGGEFCSICTAGINYVKSVCQKKFKIPLLISGTSTRVDEQSPFEITSTHPSYIRKVLKKNGFLEKEINDFLILRHYELPAIEKMKMKLQDTDYEQINLPDYLPWNNHTIQDVLENELGWETPDKALDHIDCKFAPVKYYLKNKQIPHFIFKQEKYSQLIRDGQMRREDALYSLEKMKAQEGVAPMELESFINFFDLEPVDTDNMEGRSHLDYISQADLVVKEDVFFKLMSIPWKLYKTIRHQKK